MSQSLSLSFNAADYTILGIVIISVAISLVRGFVREGLSLTTWILAFWVGLKFHDVLEKFLSAYIHTPSVNAVVSFILLFIGILLLGGLTNLLIGKAIKKTGLSGADRFFGLFFGFTRGVLLVAIIILLGEMTAFAHDQWWQESTLIPHFQWLVDWLRGFLPTQFTHVEHFIAG